MRLSPAASVRAVRVASQSATGLEVLSGSNWMCGICLSLRTGQCVLRVSGLLVSSLFRERVIFNGSSFVPGMTSLLWIYWTVFVDWESSGEVACDGLGDWHVQESCMLRLYDCFVDVGVPEFVRSTRQYYGWKMYDTSITCLSSHKGVARGDRRLSGRCGVCFWVDVGIEKDYCRMCVKSGELFSMKQLCFYFFHICDKAEL